MEVDVDSSWDLALSWDWEVRAFARCEEALRAVVTCYDVSEQ